MHQFGHDHFARDFGHGRVAQQHHYYDLGADDDLAVETTETPAETSRSGWVQALVVLSLILNILSLFGGSSR